MTAASRVGRSCLYRRSPLSCYTSVLYSCPTRTAGQRLSPLRRRQLQLQQRSFSYTRYIRQEHRGPKNESFGARLGQAWKKTKVEWKPIPVGLGIGFLGLLQLIRVAREGGTEGDSEADHQSPVAPSPPKRPRVYPTGGWQVQVMSTLPLKAISRVWGRFNELTIPYYLRVPGFRLYGWIFGVNFEEMAEPDLHRYPNLASFFYRELKPGARPVDPNPQALLSPADAKVLQFGTIEDGEVEQVKGMTYKLDALLGRSAPITPGSHAPFDIYARPMDIESFAVDDAEAKSMAADHEFANMNGISYTLPQLFSGSQPPGQPRALAEDESTTPPPASEAEVRAELASAQQPWWSPRPSDATPTKLYYVVVYLAPGDYHRFHSSVSWVCTSSRHFVGELYSVSPYVQRLLPGLFTLNERVVLLGRWKYGFFSYTPVGATNVGSIRINFDRELRTNSLTTDTEADRQAAVAAARGEEYCGFSEATYEKASKVLGGYALRRGEEMGGFALGSSIVLVFEAPAGVRKMSLDQGDTEEEPVQGGFRWCIERNQRVKVGQTLGYVDEE